MELKIIFWHWLAFGLILAGLEIFLFSFTIIWFGFGALVVSLCLFLWPSIPLAWQLLLWTFASLSFAIIWFKIIKPRARDKTMAGISREAVISQTGIVITTPEGEKRGVVRFYKPILGADEWPFICKNPLKCGDRVRIKDVSGNTLIVEK